MELLTLVVYAVAGFLAGTALSITISVGVALAKGTDATTPDELLRDADRALYKAKEQGRNRVHA